MMIAERADERWLKLSQPAARLSAERGEKIAKEKQYLFV